METEINHVKALVAKAANATEAEDAQKFAQAALNLANTLATLNREFPDEPAES